MINGAYEILVRISRQFSESILGGGRRNFRNERGRGGRTSVMFTQTKATEVNATQYQGSICLREINYQGKMDSYTGTLSFIHVIVMENLPINTHIKNQKQLILQ